MRSAVAEELKARQLERVKAMTPAERVDAALRLGDELVAAYASTHGVSKIEARRILRDNAERLRPRPFLRKT